MDWQGRLKPSPPRSPAVIHLGFLLWGSIKGRVQRAPIGYLNDAENEVKNAIEKVSAETLQDVWKNTKRDVTILHV